eukprot:CAMPEP_0183298008 /NCGR_PEP_ID=MMETSP0160_2-20130417/5147_1 /TAXON_ID=2839 ORGANISM="Odontella Sinensis, Strain Grunow 1884" /NCGR_SAMPLE_ID=MMETSP0160_2 /ASSEMBLY_ACC=CAM_ASM_000250 /LENGTH=204 /DNA_ID=CAMNT_0025459937 /DNA_START=106 /DNA_END=720 /DNA_ORIENTATION=-
MSGGWLVPCVVDLQEEGGCVNAIGVVDHTEGVYGQVADADYDEIEEEFMCEMADIGRCLATVGTCDDQTAACDVEKENADGMSPAADDAPKAGGMDAATDALQRSLRLLLRMEKEVRRTIDSEEADDYRRRLRGCTEAYAALYGAARMAKQTADKKDHSERLVAGKSKSAAASTESPLVGGPNSNYLLAVGCDEGEFAEWDGVA